MPRFSECWRCGNSFDIGIICELCGVAKYCSENCKANDIFRHDAECNPASIIKICTTCKKSGPNLKACTGCYEAFYCDTKCQRKNWQRHKFLCLTVKKLIKATTKRVLEIYCVSSTETAASCSYYYWGNIPAFDYLNLLENEGAEYESILKLLVLGVGDMRNVALTCAMLPDALHKKVLFTLNDRNSCVLARLVLLIYMLAKGGSQIEKVVTEIWYSILLSKATYDSLRTTLEELVGIPHANILTSKTASLITIDEAQFTQLQEVWKCWLGLQVVGTDWIQTQRRIEADSDSELISRTTEYIGSVPTEHTNAVKKWIKDGVFQRTHGPIIAENPTLTGFFSWRSSYIHCIDGRNFPFTGWDYLEVKKFKSSDCLVTMYGEYIESILRAFMKRICKRQVSFQILLCDCMEVQKHFEPGTVFDRILTSNLMDYLFLPSLLQTCSRMLNHDNNYATIVTETIRWVREFAPQAGLLVPSLHHSQLTTLLERTAFADTKRSVKDHGRSLIEYFDNSWAFTNFLRAVFYAHSLIKNVNRKDIIPSVKELGKEFQLRLRDGVRNENRIAFFKLAVNRRRVTTIYGWERFLEWVPLKKSS